MLQKRNSRLLQTELIRSLTSLTNKFKEIEKIVPVDKACQSFTDGSMSAKDILDTYFDLLKAQKGCDEILSRILLRVSSDELDDEEKELLMMFRLANDETRNTVVEFLRNSHGSDQ